MKITNMVGFFKYDTPKSNSYRQSAVYGCSVQSQACRGMKVIVLPLQSTSSKRLNRQ